MPPSEPPAGRPRGRVRRWPWYVLGGVAATLAGGELFARYYLGLGDPPLSVADARTEYRFAPGVSHRFGRTISINDYSMRSGPVTPHKTNPAELRVLVVGDSIVNGGVLTGDAELATSLLQTRLTRDLGRPVTVCNISAGSWGPPNERAYLDAYGWFDADALVIVASSHDGFDVPTFNSVVGVSPEFPDRKPWLALWEAFARYTGVGRRLTAAPVPPGNKPDPLDTPENERTCRDAYDALFAQARAAGRAAFLVINYERTEAEAGRLNASGGALTAAAADYGVPVLDFGVVQAAALKAGRNPYRDAIHPNADGQALLAELIRPALESALAGRGKGGPTTAPAVGPTTASIGNDSLGKVTR